MDNLVIVIILSGIVAVLVVAYLDLVRKSKFMSGQEVKAQEKARLKSEMILEEAKERAMQIVREAKMLSEDQKDELEEQWRGVIRKVSREFETEAEDEVKGFRKSLELEAVGVEKAVADRIEKEFAAAKQQIEEYKKEKLSRLDAEIVEITKDAVKNVVGKVIPMGEHKRLIISALEEAKREHIL